METGPPRDEASPPAIDELALLSYRRLTAELYRGVRRRGPSQDTWSWWTGQRDELFASHPASPFVAGRRAFDGLRYHPYDPALNLGEVEVAAVEHPPEPLAHSGLGETGSRRFGSLLVDLAGVECRLAVSWLEGYGGGVFLAFRDATNGSSTYGGGRYLLDTVKGADLGGGTERLVLDLNFAYHPSCVHDPRWSCPLAPYDERLPVAVAAGERLSDAAPPAPATASGPAPVGG
jgi:uncharacterized protein